MMQTFKATLLIIIFVSFISCSGLNKSIPNNSTKLPNQNLNTGTLYKVESISINGSVYVIKLSKNDSVFKVLTEYSFNPLKRILVGDSYENCKTRVIKVGESYQLKLDKLYEYKLEKNSIPNEAIIHFVEYNGTNIEIQINQILYTTQNLKGLCLIQSDK